MKNVNISEKEIKREQWRLFIILILLTLGSIAYIAYIALCIFYN